MEIALNLSPIKDVNPTKAQCKEIYPSALNRVGKCRLLNYSMVLLFLLLLIPLGTGAYAIYLLPSYLEEVNTTQDVLLLSAVVVLYLWMAKALCKDFWGIVKDTLSISVSSVCVWRYLNLRIHEGRTHKAALSQAVDDIRANYTELYIQAVREFLAKKYSKS